jgi:hypothetical protein
MTEPQTTDNLIRKYLERVATAAELADLERRLAQPQFAEAFADACRMDTWLRLLIKEENQVAHTRTLCDAIDSATATTSRSGDFGYGWRGVAVAVSILIICFGLWRLVTLPSRPASPAHKTSPEGMAHQAPSKRAPLPDTRKENNVHADNTPLAAVAMLGLITANAVR